MKLLGWAAALLLGVLTLPTRAAGEGFLPLQSNRSYELRLPFNWGVFEGHLYTPPLDIQTFLDANGFSLDRWCHEYRCWGSKGLTCQYEDSVQVYLCLSRMYYYEDTPNTAQQIHLVRNSYLMVLVYNASFGLLPAHPMSALRLQSYAVLPIADRVTDTLSLGPEDPHLLCSPAGHRFVLYCALTESYHRRFFVYSFESGTSTELKYSKYDPERNWVPIRFLSEHVLEVLFRPEPWETLECDLEGTGVCRERGAGHREPHALSEYRGSTEFLFLPRQRLFLGFLRSITTCGKQYSFYRIYLLHLLLLDVEGRPVAVSSPLNLAPFTNRTFERRNVIIATSIPRYDAERDELVVMVNLQDRLDAVMVLQRFSRTLEEVLSGSASLDQFRLPRVVQTFKTKDYCRKQAPFTRRKAATKRNGAKRQ